MDPITAAEIELRLGFDDCFGVYTVLFGRDRYTGECLIYVSIDTILKTLN